MTTKEPIEKYRMVDNPDEPGTRQREYYYVDPETGEEVDAPAGATESRAAREADAGTSEGFSSASQPREQEERLTSEEAEEARRAGLEAATEAIETAVEEDERKRTEWAEAEVAKVTNRSNTDIEGQANLAASADDESDA